MIKLPEPYSEVGTFAAVGYNAHRGDGLYTEAQMLQFRTDALEEAAKVCDDHDKYPSLTPRHCAEAIRELKEGV